MKNSKESKAPVTPTMQQQLSDAAAQRLVAQMIAYLKHGGWSSETDEIDEQISAWLLCAEFPASADRAAGVAPTTHPHTEICPQCYSDSEVRPYTAADGTKMCACGRCFIQWRSVSAGVTPTPPTDPPRWDADFTKEPYMKLSQNGEWVRFVDVAAPGSTSGPTNIEKLVDAVQVFLRHDGGPGSDDYDASAIYHARRSMQSAFGLRCPRCGETLPHLYDENCTDYRDEFAINEDIANLASKGVRGQDAAVGYKNLHEQLDALGAPRSDMSGNAFSVNGRFAYLRQSVGSTSGPTDQLLDALRGIVALAHEHPLEPRLQVARGMAERALGGGEVEGGATPQVYEKFYVPEANDVLRRLNKEVFADSLDIDNLANGINLVLDFAEKYARERGAAPLMEQSAERYKPVLSLTNKKQSPPEEAPSNAFVKRDYGNSTCVHRVRFNDHCPECHVEQSPEGK